MTLNEAKCPDGQYYCNDSKKCKPIPKGHHVMPDGKLMKGEKHSMNEVAPPTKKHERMVKHIKKSYGKKGGLSDEEKSIAYATAWKNYNKKETFEYEKLKKKIGSKEKHMKPVIAEGEYGKLKGWEKSILQGGLKVRSGASYDREMARLVKMYPGFKAEGVEDDKLVKSVKSKQLEKMNKLYKDATNPKKPKGMVEDIKRFDKLTKAIKGSDVKKDKEVKLMKIAGKVRSIPEKKEMTYQEAIDAGWEMTGEGIWWPPQPETVTEKISFKSFRGVLDKKKKKEEKKPEKAQDAGARAKRKLARKAHAKYVSGSEDNVPDDIRDHKEYTE